MSGTTLASIPIPALAHKSTHRLRSSAEGNVDRRSRPSDGFLVLLLLGGLCSRTLGFELRPGQHQRLAEPLEADNGTAVPIPRTRSDGTMLVTTFGSVFSLEEGPLRRWHFVDGLRTPRRISAISFDSFRLLILAAFDSGIEYFDLDTLETVAGPRDFGFISHIAVVDLDISRLRIAAESHGSFASITRPPWRYQRATDGPRHVRPAIGPSLTTRRPIRLDGAASWDRETG